MENEQEKQMALNMKYQLEAQMPSLRLKALEFAGQEYWGEGGAREQPVPQKRLEIAKDYLNFILNG